jgi:hypothetical protein
MDTFGGLIRSHEYKIDNFNIDENNKFNQNTVGNFGYNTKEKICLSFVYSVYVLGARVFVKMGDTYWKVL